MRPYRRIGNVIGGLLLTASLFVVYRQFGHFNFSDAWREMLSLDMWRPFLALLLIAADYAVMTQYDRMALSLVGRRLRMRTIAAASFISHVFTINVDMVFGSSVAFRLYRTLGVSAHEIATIVFFSNLSFLLGFLGLGAVLFPFATLALPPSDFLSHVSLRIIGMVCLVAMSIYLTLSILRRQPTGLWKWTIPVVPLATALKQVGLAITDWMLAGSAAFVFLPPLHGVPFTVFLAMFLLSQLLGQLSQAPAGLGVFEASMLYLLSSYAPSPAIFGALLLYRLTYYLLPLFLGTALLAWHEWRRL